mgnify:FL=1|jgi:hypothetical protein
MPQANKKWLYWIISSLGIGGAMLVMLLLLLGVALMGMLVASSEATYKGTPLGHVEQLDVPLPLLTVFLRAENGFVTWSQLAAIVKVNTDFGRHPAVNEGVGFSGLPDFLWEQFQRDGDGDGAMDPDNPEDAIFSLAATVSHWQGSFHEALRSLRLGEGEIAEIADTEAKYRFALIRVDGWLWPLIGHTTVSSPYGLRSDPFTGETAFHDGIDLPAPVGTPVLAIRDGFVTAASLNYGGYGHYVRIDHQNGVDSFYGHLSVIGVEAGQFVYTGQIIGAVGSTGRSTGPHLHLGMIEHGQSVDPMEKWIP